MQQNIINNPRINTSLKTSDFYYDLPSELIAQHPAKKRDESRLLSLDRSKGVLSHHRFYEIVEMLRPEDTLVINDSKVIPARLMGVAENNPNRVLEFLLLRQRGKDLWESLSRPGKHAKIGTRFIFGEGCLMAEVVDIVEEGNRLLRFEYNPAEGNIYTLLEQVGTLPLPPYITEELKDAERYQTVYAREEGSAAAPTAGLHFTEELLCRIKNKGCALVPVLLHVGLGTFRPVKVDSLAKHHMHSEYFSVSPESAETINRRKAAGGRIIAVGTTACRVLETVSDDSGRISPISGDTGIFIYPGYRFKAVDALITNFHLPESTLLMLVSAFAGRERILDAYKAAIAEKYRFFSFGDAMFIY